MKDIVVILNPFAGNLETVRDWQERVESIVRGLPIRITSHPGDAEALARRAVEEGFARVVAAGGDGTVNHVANGIAGSNAALGILPMGTVNVFAMELGLPSNDLERCWKIVQAGNTRLVDLPSANGKYFVQLGGIGLDAQAVKETTLAFKRSLGPLSYLISAAHIAARQPPKLFIESEDAECGKDHFSSSGTAVFTADLSHFSSKLLLMMVYSMWLCSRGWDSSKSLNICMTLYSAPISAFRKLNIFRLANFA